MKKQLWAFAQKHDLTITVILGISWGVAFALLLAYLMRPTTMENLAALDSLLGQ